MSNSWQVIAEKAPNQERANDLMKRLLAIATPSSVFSEPVTQGEYTVITAAEVTAGMGYGYGGGAGYGGSGKPQAAAQQAAAQQAAAQQAGAQQTGVQEEGQRDEGGGYGGGGGGGGTVMGRPVAAIEIGPHGVRVEPIVDPTKIVLAFFTAFGSMFIMLYKMQKAARMAIETDELELDE